MGTAIIRYFVRGVATPWIVLLLLPGASPAQTLDVPVTVQAAADGSFSYQAIFTAGPGGDNVFGWDYSDLENTDVGAFFADEFCLFPLAEGETSVFDIPIDPEFSGFLLNPAEEGSVKVSITTDCPDGSNLFLSVTTTILPFSPPVPTLPEWGLVVLIVLLTSAAIVSFRRTNSNAIAQ
jgi:hypothetical protein